MNSPPQVRLEFPFDARKAVAVVAYLAARVPELDRFKLAKLVFLADEYHLVTNGRPIVGGSYWALPAGPVPEELLDAVRRLAGVSAPRDVHGIDDNLAEVVCIDHGPEYPIIRIGEREASMSVLSETDVAALNVVIDRYAPMGFKELYDLTHAKESYRRAWASRPQGARSARMNYADFFLGNPDARIPIEDLLPQADDE